MHPAEKLWRDHHPSVYPDGVVRVREVLPGRGFFPGGLGLSEHKLGQSPPAFPTGGVMVLGHDFHSEEGYEESRKRGFERETQATWRQLITLFRAVDLPLKSCFFTNFYMGLRKGTNKEGKFPGASDRQFRTHCEKFLCTQLRAQQPAVVITLGLWVPPAIATLSPELNCWRRKASITAKDLDSTDPVRKDVSFRAVENLKTVVVALIHPSHRSKNVIGRRYRSLTGNDAEIQMLKDALAMSDLPDKWRQ